MDDLEACEELLNCEATTTATANYNIESYCAELSHSKNSDQDQANCFCLS